MNKANTKIGIIFTLSIIAILISGIAIASKVPATTNGGATVVIPAHAVEVAPGVFDLGTAIDVDGRVVEGFMFLHDNKKENAKPPWAGGGGKGGDTKCYETFAKGAKWKTVEQYITGPGVDTAVTQASLDSWNAVFTIFGARDALGVVDGADDVSPDGKNEVEFVNLGPSNTIAYTIVWGIFGGPPRNRELVEWDAVFNTDYAFGDADVDGNAVMDYQNIATHEFGHSAGLTHPTDTCTEETMYAFADFGETKKRDLNAGDISGINSLY